MCLLHFNNLCSVCANSFNIVFCCDFNSQVAYVLLGLWENLQENVLFCAGKAMPLCDGCPVSDLEHQHSDPAHPLLVSSGALILRQKYNNIGETKCFGIGMLTLAPQKPLRPPRSMPAREVSTTRPSPVTPQTRGSGRKAAEKGTR